MAGAPALCRAEPPAPSSASVASPASEAQPGPAENEFPVLLGSYTTTLIGSLPDRTANIRIAAQALDGTILRPGDVLSFNLVVGPRTRERGYRDAPVILHESRQIQVGGGVCQAASTLFVAGLLSGLSVAERHRHSSAVDYIPLAYDATIAWGVKDLKLENDLDQRVRVRAEVLGSTLGVRFEGESEPTERFELESVERELPGDPGVEGGVPGREIELYRVRKTGGESLSRDFVLRDTYPPSRPRDSLAER